MFLLNGKRINIDAQRTVGDVTYPNLRDPSLRAALGVTEVPDPVYPNPELFYWTENEDGTLVITPKSAEQIKEQDRQKNNAKALEYLASTDWYVIRSVETTIKVPKEVSEQRALMRSIYIPDPL